jgi:hypothetical protein
MIKHEQDFTPEELRQLDLLVDGELGNAARRQLLTVLEARPDGWRRCALAFLEAQSWGSELRSFAAPQKTVAIEPAAVKPASEIPAGPVVEFHPRSRWNIPNVSVPWAMAATFLLAFGLAWMIRAPGSRHVTAGGDAQAPVVANLANATPRARDASRASHAAADSDRMDTVRLVMDDGAHGMREVDLPVEDTSADDAWLSYRQPVVPRELRQALERMGHRVNERRQFLPVQLDDGRQMVVPVDQVEFTPVSNAYQ